MKTAHGTQSVQGGSTGPRESFIDHLIVKKYYKQFNLAYHPITNATQIKIKFCLLNWLSKGMISLVKNRETLTYS